LNTLNTSIIGFVILFLLGCVIPASGPIFKLKKVSTNKANVYIFRSDKDSFRGHYAAISVDGSPLAKLKPNGYVVISLEPEDYDFTLMWVDQWLIELNQLDRINTLLQLEPGEEYFIKLESYVENSFIKWRFVVLEKTESIEEIIGARLQPLELEELSAEL